MTDAVRERYERFAREEAPGRSELYEEWAQGAASDPEVRRVLARIPEAHRQPPLVFAVTRTLGAPLEGFSTWRAFLLAHEDAVVAECAARSVQTNEPLRLAPLLPVLSEIDGPIALLEIGASGGLCLYPDRYSYRFVGEDGALRSSLDPADGPSAVVLTSEVRGAMPAVSMPEIVWRAGIDLAPLDARSPRDRAWLQGLVWPGERGREERIAAALDVVAADPPRMTQGDALDLVAEVAASAPRHATLVITTPGVLAHIPRAARLALIDRVRALPARWITIDAPTLHEAWEPPVDAAAWPGFVVALDGDVRASADPLGRWWEWRADEAASRT
ncbi:MULTISPECIES: DUF2332 domain-containing protein [unclassified Microbacterium]|uniref:DUF2332 domain-containing protein n=1 Tax=unclassified Microbacterium TaxID=2609290 RepID=UPI002C3E5E34|nr:DUF2332 domain-containing protein [Microbacterium sp.]HWK78233.1 DUF2332 domain-containing protein [Microbacterium sp.]